MRERHQIEAKDFLDFQGETLLAASHGEGASKTLYMITDVSNKNVIFRTIDHGKIYFWGKLEDAVEHYNSLE